MQKQKRISKKSKGFLRHWILMGGGLLVNASEVGTNAKKNTIIHSFATKVVTLAKPLSVILLTRKSGI